MLADEYQKAAASFAIDLPKKDAMYHGVLGLVGETGEIAEKFKKHIRDGTPINYHDMEKELGDVLWYVSYLGGLFGVSLSDIAMKNIQKLQSRKERGVIGGSGDNR